MQFPTQKGNNLLENHRTTTHKLFGPTKTLSLGGKRDIDL